MADGRRPNVWRRPSANKTLTQQKMFYLLIFSPIFNDKNTHKVSDNELLDSLTTRKHCDKRRLKRALNKTKTKDVRHPPKIAVVGRRW